jgi:hypothetical protein
VLIFNNDHNSALIITCLRISFCIEKVRAWLDWGPWSGCSASCDGGLRSRSRDLNITSSVDQYWQGGEFTQVQICGRSACSGMFTRHMQNVLIAH